MNKWGLSYAEIDTVQTMNPETAAHNIALVYIQSSFDSKIPAKSDSDNVNPDAIFAVAEKYVNAYHYAYNYVAKQNEIINSAE